jgi:AcrR family transcriptional regulator
MSRNIQEHILNTASDLFYRQGIHCTGVDTIVKAAGVAKMSLYRYFPSKDDLILAYLRRNSGFLLEQVRQGFETGRREGQARLLTVFDVFDSELNKPGFLGCPFIKASAEFIGGNEAVHQASAEFYRDLCTLLSAQAVELGIENAQEKAEQLLLLLGGAVVREQMQPGCGAMRHAVGIAQLLIAERQ